MRPTARFALALWLAFATLATPASWAQEIADDPAPAAPTPGAPPVPGVSPDFPIPGGWFYTQALPGRSDGGGFAVTDGHGAALWTAYQAAGGVEALGYPISTRFEWDSAIAQAFSEGILRWDGVARQAEVRPLDALPGKRPPAYATLPDRPPIAGGEAAVTPWSGWWWPSFDGVGPTLYSPSGPLAKYDRMVLEVTGENPRTREWERANLYFPSSDWAGHCNGWAAASLLEPEPTEAREVGGVLFTPGDQKGLLSSYHFADAAAWLYGDEGEVNPADFHRQLLQWLGTGGKGFVVTFDLGRGEVWSYPAYRFETEWGPDGDAQGRWRVRTTVWMAEANVPPDFLGLKPYPGPAGQVFEYVLDGDPRDPDGGEWVGRARTGGRLARPGRIWYPEPAVRNMDRELASPSLEIERIYAIMAPVETEAAVTAPAGAD